MKADSSALPKGWLAFELNILRRLKFASMALPFSGNAALGTSLKRWGVQVYANDALQSNWFKAVATIRNNTQQLREQHVAAVLEDAYVPRHKLYNPALRNWFNETDAWWFDNVREKIERLESPIVRALAFKLGMAVGDYALSFDEETLELRQPLSHVYRRLWNALPPPVDNNKENVCSNLEPREFVAESFTDSIFIRLPRPHNVGVKSSLGWTAWREDWVRGTDSFWSALERQQAGRLGTHIETKHQYLRLVEDMLHTASHLPNWIIAHIEDNFISAQELVDVVSQIRRVETIYTKDFSELTGAKAVIITA